MKQRFRLLCGLFFFSICAGTARGQQTVPATGGTATGTGGSVSYTVGQTTFHVLTGTTEFIIEGVQQPFEISVLTAIDNTDDILLEYSVYPNPTTGMIWLVIGSPHPEEYSFQLFDMSGRLFRLTNITESKTEISLSNIPGSLFFLRVIRDNLEIKVFKIVKR